MEGLGATADGTAFPPAQPAAGGGNPARFAFSCLFPVCARDDARHLDEALRSVFANTLCPAQTIICEDGQLTPAQENILAMLGDEFSFERIRNPGPPGLHHNLNHALPKIVTPWICRADADDVNLTNRFQEQASFLAANPLVTVLGSDITEIGPDGSLRRKHMPEQQAEILRWAVYRNPVNHMTAFVATDALRNCGGYPSIPLKEDYALWLRMLAEGYRFANLPQPLVRVRLGADFYRRRSGVKHILSEARLHPFRVALSGTGHGRAALAAGARMLALAASPYAVKHIYETRLR